jgi:hypothetical protein
MATPALVDGIRRVVGDKVADTLNLDILPKESIKELAELFGVDEKTSAAEECTSLYADFSEELMIVAREHGPAALAEKWNAEWPGKSALIEKIIGRAPLGVRPGLIEVHDQYVDEMRAQIAAATGLPLDEEGPALVDDVGGVGAGDVDPPRR